MLAQTIMTGAKLGIFDALAEKPLTTAAVALKCGLDPEAGAKLLRALEGSGYVRFRSGTHELATVARRWLLASRASSFRDGVLHRSVDLAVMKHYDEYARTGRPVDFHALLTPEQWDLYQRGQRAHAGLMVKELALRLPVRRAAHSLLDIGGGHGLYSVALCNRHRNLHATILDLPGAIRAVSGLLDSHECRQRIQLRAGNALKEDLGCRVYDVVLLANVMHHFSPEANQALLRRVSRALRPGGSCVILELIRSANDQPARQLEGLLDLYFSAASQGGLCAALDLASWQTNAGLKPQRLRRLLTVPDCGMQIATKE
jgi:SAM-dependent methyltransferase